MILNTDVFLMLGRSSHVLELLHEALDALPEEFHQVLTLHYFGGMTSSEIARFIGMAPETVRRKIIRARGLLKVEMLDTMRVVFEEQCPQASFTFRILEQVKHIRVRPLPRLAELPWSVSTGTFALAIVLSLGIFGGFVYHNMKAATPGHENSEDISEILVDIVEREAIERQEDIIMSNRKQITIVSIITAILGILSGNVMGLAEAPGLEWEKTYGGVNNDSGESSQQTADGGYIVVSSTNSFGAGSYDINLIKTDNLGAVEWDRTYGDTRYDQPYCVKQTADGGYIISAKTDSFGAGSYDAYLIKTDALGNVEWSNTYGGSAYDIATSIRQIPNNGYIVCGLTYSKGAGNADAYLFKIDDLGNMEWDQVYGYANYELAYCVEQTADGGYVITGWTRSYGEGGADTG